jgi:adenylylsulfate kinase
MGKILWCTGNSRSGKSTLAKNMLELVRESTCINDQMPVWLDGDEIRQVWPELGFSKEDRIENNMKFARLAKILYKQGFSVIVSTICPYRELRDKIRRFLGKNNVQFIYLSGGKEPTIEYPYESRQEGEGE